MSFDRKAHKKVMADFLNYCNKRSDKYILKDGTALMFCYNLDRFSEDIDLDGLDKSIEKIVTDYAKNNSYTFRVAKNTDTVLRFMLTYNKDMEYPKPLKIEISFRKAKIDPDEYTIVNGIQVYNINRLCQLKTLAYMGRDKIRDLYDLSFICNNYFDSLDDNIKNLVKDSLSSKGIEQFDYIIKTQEDELIDNDILAENFLNMFDKFNLLTTENERETLAEYNSSDFSPIP